MFRIEKTFEVSGSHKLDLPYESKCTKLHGHNWKITVVCSADELNDDGMVIDFQTIKEKIKDKLDHEHLNDVLHVNPTAENLAMWICERVPCCEEVTVEESEGNVATYIPT
jgi:6-pyruvoyltetrahydropterin/6-carboxytetrahydropterin synthase